MKRVLSILKEKSRSKKKLNPMKIQTSFSDQSLQNYQAVPEREVAPDRDTAPDVTSSSEKSSNSPENPHIAPPPINALQIS